ncbi:MAG: flagellar type III secretion system pore protein FliP [Clostridiales bacterium]|nr:flagellar type III secretion system pore protein FliP [Clostridiales bacterium]
MRPAKISLALITLAFFITATLILCCFAQAKAIDFTPIPTPAEAAMADEDEPPGAGTLNTLVRTLFGDNAQTVDIIILLTILTLLPSILIMLTGFTRIIIVLSFVRNALGMQQTPPNQVLVGLALFLTFFVMQPVLSDVYQNAYIPYTEGTITQSEFIEAAMTPTRDFMMRQTMKNDLEFFVDLSKSDIQDYDDIPTSVLIPAFLTSEIKHAFQMGFFIYLPFIVIDMVVSSTLMAMGMMMLPPAMISLPFKVLLFVMVNGWQLVVGTLIRSFN